MQAINAGVSLPVPLQGGAAISSQVAQTVAKPALESSQFPTVSGVGGVASANPASVTVSLGNPTALESGVAQVYSLAEVRRAEAPPASATQGAEPTVDEGPTGDPVEENARGAQPVEGVRPEAQPNADSESGIAQPAQPDTAPQEGRESAPDDSGSPRNSDSSSQRFSEAELQVIEQLKVRDREVRLHEAQHQAVGGQYAGSASFSYETGPNGVQYAVGGEVGISLSKVSGNPEATIAKMRTVRNAALAPAEPSSQDRAVAAQATQIILESQKEIALEKAEELKLQQQEREERREEQAERTTVPDSTAGIQTYENFIRLGQAYQASQAGATNSISEFV
ncbi:MAG: hypothetical protein MI864_02965 [Pseudomonadales bacterium]|nr:hypothetical protein [Pseudomonadales bacterium]